MVSHPCINNNCQYYDYYASIDSEYSKLKTVISASIVIDLKYKLRNFGCLQPSRTQPSTGYYEAQPFEFQTELFHDRFTSDLFRLHSK